jgi:hypothetical protein
VFTPTSSSYANAFYRDLPQIIAVIISDLPIVRYHIKHCPALGEVKDGGWEDTVCSMVLDVLESIVPSHHSVAAIA